MNDLDHSRMVPTGGVPDFSDEHDAFRNTARGAFDFRYIFAAIRANLWLVVGIIVSALALAVVVTMLDTPRYTASSSIQINDAGDRVIGENDDTTAAANSSYDIDRFLKTQTDVIRSRGMATRVGQKLKLFGNSDFYTAMESGTPPAGTAELRVRNQTIGLLLGNLQVDLPRDSRIVTLKFNSADPAYAANVVNAFASELIQANLQRKFDSTSYARDFVGGQLAEAKLRLESSERELNDYAREAGIIRTQGATATENNGGGSNSGTVTSASLLQLNSVANEARAARIAAEARWRAVSTGTPLASRDVLSNATVNSLLTQRANLEANLQEDLARHLDDYPSVVQKRAELSRLNSELNNQIAAVRNSIRKEYDAARETEERLAGQVLGLKSETLNEQDLGVRFAILERATDTNRTLYDGLLQRFNELNASAGIAASNVSIIDRADVPLSPSSPNLMKNLLIALIAGFGAAAVSLFLKDQFDDAIRVPEDIEHKLRLALLGVIPRSKGTRPDDELADPKTPISEGYNSLRGALLYSTPEGLPQIMLVTSAQPSEGKTTTSYAIAAGFARMGRKVILVDADLRRPSVHRRIGSDNSVGLTTLLTSHEPLSAAVRPSPFANLSMMTSGPVPPSPTELLTSTRMEHVLQELAREFEVVVIDSPPILGLADSPVLSALADGVVFVVESDRSRRGALKMALRRLRSMRPILLGAVLTKFDPARAGNRYSEYYGYHYYQYESREKEAA
jgi:succinoglycan biosynthesis transport protein ExoP